MSSITRPEKISYREAKNRIAEHVLDPRRARLAILVLFRWAGKGNQISPVFLKRIIARASEQK